MTGRELSERLRSFRPDLRRLFMSGYTANAIAHQEVLDPGVLFLQKQFSARALAEKVRDALRNQIDTAELFCLRRAILRID
jgi:FixJ family two-component response regulator